MKYFTSSRIQTITLIFIIITMEPELGLGKPRPHTRKVIRERREQIIVLRVIGIVIDAQTINITF